MALVTSITVGDSIVVGGCRITLTTLSGRYGHARVSHYLGETIIHNQFGVEVLPGVTLFLARGGNTRGNRTTRVGVDAPGMYVYRFQPNKEKS